MELLMNFIFDDYLYALLFLILINQKFTNFQFYNRSTVGSLYEF